MIPFTTTDAEKVQLYAIASLMKAAGLPDGFIAATVKHAEEYQGTFDLMVLWRDAGDSAEGVEEREEIVSDLQEIIDEAQEAPSGIQEKPYIPFDDLPTVAAKIVAFKQDLRSKVDRWGGVTKLARETGIPQPSLSRFFATASMPRRTTLYRIAKALNLAESEIATDWIR